MADVTVTEVVEVVTVAESVVAVTVTDSGSPGTPGPAIELQTSATHIQWKVAGADSWINLIALADLEGPAGQDGREVELQNNGTHIQWRYVGGSWANLVALSSLVGASGAAATIAVGSVTTGAPGSSAAVVNSGTTAAAVFDFTIPRGAAGIDGIDGDDGAAATIAVGNVTTGAPGSSATVTNVGTTGAAVFDFQIPRGQVGATGAGITAGVVEIDFGSTPTNEASVTVTGQTGIQTTSTVDATIMARSTADNTLSDHQFAALSMRLSVSQPVADTGFTITAYNLIGFATGRFQINWRWS